MMTSGLYIHANFDSWVLCLIGLLLWGVYFRYLYKKMSPDFRFFSLVFVTMYCLNCLLGGILIGLSEGEWLIRLQPQGGYKILVDQGVHWPSYWFFLFAPLYIFPTFLFLANSIPPLQFSKNFSKPLWNLEYLIPFICGLMFFLSFYDYPFYRFIEWAQGGKDYNQMVLARGSVLSSLNYFVINIFYVLAPVTACVLAREWIETKKWKFGVLLALTLVLLLAFTILTYQKILFLMALLSIGIYLLFLQLLPIPMLILAGSSLPAILFLAFVVLEIQFSFQEVIFHFVLRTSAAVPYFAHIAQNSPFFMGYDVPLDGRTVQDNVEVFRYMFPLSTWSGGTSSSPHHMRAYFQSGFLFVLVEYAFLSLFVVFINGLNKAFEAGKPYFQALLIVMFFYLSQSSLKDCIISAYGVTFPLIFLIFLLMLNKGSHDNQT